VTATSLQGRLALAACAVLVDVFATACSPQTIDAVTSGDGHVAVTGMPDASRDHAVAPPDHAAVIPPDVPGYHTDGTRIVDPSGNPFRIKAVSWYGLESNFAPLGLYSLSLDTILSQVQSLGFNTLRMTWSSEMLDAGSKPMSINGNVNPDLAKLTTPLQILDEIVHRAPRFGLKVILSRHQSSAGHQDDLWYNTDFTQDRFNTDWVILAAHYVGDPTVIGCDLQSDLRDTATWGDGVAKTDWKAAAEVAGNLILHANPAVLIFVQGVEKSSDGSSYWRGGNLKDAAKHPVKLDLPNRLVYATQDFARTANDPPQGMQPLWFSDRSYPTNLEGVWTANWGYLLGGAPVFLAAFGTPNKDLSDQQWLQTLEQYIQGHDGLSFAYWALNPESSDVKGVYSDQWLSTSADIVSALQPILAP
jgi:endoglucanase